MVRRFRVDLDDQVDKRVDYLVVSPRHIFSQDRHFLWPGTHTGSLLCSLTTTTPTTTCILRYVTISPATTFPANITCYRKYQANRPTILDSPARPATWQPPQAASLYSLLFPRYRSTVSTSSSSRSSHYLSVLIVSDTCRLRPLPSDLFTFYLLRVSLILLTPSQLSFPYSVFITHPRTSSTRLTTSTTHSIQYTEGPLIIYQLIVPGCVYMRYLAVLPRNTRRPSRILIQVQIQMIPS